MKWFFFKYPTKKGDRPLHTVESEQEPLYLLEMYAAKYGSVIVKNETDYINMIDKGEL